MSGEIMRFHGPTEGDYPEDTASENGNYQHECATCSQTFIGHKRRIVCKKCQAKHRAEWEAMSPGDREAHEQAIVAKINAWLWPR